jgi:hypothetical protein
MRSRQHPSTTTLFTAGRDGLGGWGLTFGCVGHKPCSHPLRACSNPPERERTWVAIASVKLTALAS